MFSKTHFASPEQHFDFFIERFIIFSNRFEISVRNFWKFSAKSSARLSKLHSTCVNEYFQRYIAIWKKLHCFHHFWTLSKKVADKWRKKLAWFSYLLCTCTEGNLEEKQTSRFKHGFIFIFWSWIFQNWILRVQRVITRKLPFSKQQVFFPTTVGFRASLFWSLAKNSCTFVKTAFCVFRGSFCSERNYRQKNIFFEISRGFTLKTDLITVHIFSSSQTLRRENPFFEWKFTAWLSKLPSTRTSNHFQEKKSSQRIHFLVTSPDSGQNNFGSIENFFWSFVKTAFCISRRSPFCFRFWTFFAYTFSISEQEMFGFLAQKFWQCFRNCTLRVQTNILCKKWYLKKNINTLITFGL